MGEPAASRATSTAAWGGQIESATSEAASSPAASPASSSPASRALAAVASERPPDAHSTRWPPSASAAPTAAPMAPGCRIPIVVIGRRA